MSQNFIKNWKLSWPRSTFSSLLIMTCEWIPCLKMVIWSFIFVDLKDFWKFEANTKLYQRLKIFMTAFLSEILHFDCLFNILISHLCVNSKSQNGILKCSFYLNLQVRKSYSEVFLCWFEKFLEFWGLVKTLSKIEKLLWPLSFAKFLISTTF